MKTKTITSFIESFPNCFNKACLSTADPSVLQNIKDKIENYSNCIFLTGGLYNNFVGFNKRNLS